MLSITILFEDDYLLIVDKPKNLLVHPSHYARNIEGPTLIDYLKEQIGVDVYPIHRLDYKTSGVLWLAKQKEVVVDCQNSLSQATKKYQAVVRGFVDGSGAIDSPVKPRDTKKHLEAKSTYRCLGQSVVDVSVGKYTSSRYSWVELEPLTGRTNQLRIHMAKINHPIVGDHRYGDRHHNKMFEEKLGLDRLWLHAFSLSFVHPKTKETLEVQTPFSDWELLSNLITFK